MQPPPLPKLYVEGRYRKLSRDLPQTVFFCPACRGHERRRHGCKTCEGFGKLTRESVQELITWVLGKAAGTRKAKFHGAGREDVDVRMLVKALEQQKMLGAAEQRLVESAAPPPRPCEDGKGCAVDVVA